MLREKIFFFCWPFLILSDWLVNFEYSAFLNIGRGLRLLLLLTVWSIVLRYWREKSRHFIFFPILLIVTGILFCYVFTGVLFGESLFEYSKLLLWVGAVLATYLLVRNGRITYEQFRKMLYFMILISLAGTILYSRSENFANDYNANAYLLTFALPVLFLDARNPQTGILFKLLALFGIGITIKKGALLCSGLGLLLYIFFYNIKYFTASSLKMTLGVLLGTGIILAVVVSYQGERIQDRFSDYGMERSVEARDEHYKFLFNRWWDSGDSQTIVFGFGDRAETWLWGDDRRLLAHSDLYGALHNNGLVGGLLLLLINLGFMRTCWRLRKTPYLPAMVMCWAIYLGASIYSGTLYSYNIFMLFSAPALAMALYDNENDRMCFESEKRCARRK